jgi:hypothetical protein
VVVEEIEIFVLLRRRHRVHEEREVDGFVPLAEGDESLDLLAGLDSESLGGCEPLSWSIHRLFPIVEKPGFVPRSVLRSVGGKTRFLR